MIDQFKMVRKKILEKGKRSETTEPDRPSPKPDQAMNKLLLKINPMENKKPEVNFPSKQKSPTSSKPQYIKKLHTQEQMGWSFLNEHCDTSAYFNQ